MQKRIIIALLLMQCLTLFAANTDQTRNHTTKVKDTDQESTQITKVEDTELARLQSVTDMIGLLPGVAYFNEEVMVLGRGVPAIYIDSRKITELSELSHIRADRVKEIEVMRHPGAEYERGVESVIVIRLKEDENEGFSLDNTLRFDMTHRLSANEELTLGWRRKQLTLGAFIGWNEERKTFEKYSFTNKYQNQMLKSEEKNLVYPEKKKQWLTTRFSLAYDFDLDNRLTFNYSLLNKNVDRNWQPQTSVLEKNPEHRHDFALEFSGKVGEWNIALGNNSFIDNIDQIKYKTKSTDNYLLSEYDLRTYLKLSRALWKGTLMFGAEHEYDHMNVEMFEDTPLPTTYLTRYSSAHMPTIPTTPLASS